MPNCFHRVDPASLRCISCGRHVFDLEDCEMVPIHDLDEGEEPEIVHLGDETDPAIKYRPKLREDSAQPTYRLHYEGEPEPPF